MNTFVPLIIKHIMKKLVYLMSAVAISLVTSCGPSAEEKAAEEKRIQDSIAAVEAHVQDSIAQVETARQDSIMASQKAAEDSLRMKAMEDSLAQVSAKLKKATTPKATPKPKTPTKPEEWKAGQGKG
ncbi:MAG: hypothetical protein IPJ86_11225 [Bacteroidetes bacterium]|nr:hypothetical protein [Bacteroidota bacterium]